MKHFFCLIAICSFALMLPSCRQEVVAPEQQISGCYALDYNGTTDTYWEFNMGRLSIFISDESYPLADKMIWDCDEDKFEEAIHGDYSITDGVLVSSWTNFGKVEFSNGKLHMAGAVYSELKGFNSEPYSVIRPSKDRLDLTYAAETVELAVNVENALPAWSLEAATTTAWISELKVENNVLSFKTSSTVTDRSGTIELKYPHAKTVNLPVSQKPSTFIKPSSESLTFGYEASSQTLSYTIENPIAGSSLNATTLALWISDIQVSDTQISFKLSENNSGADRSSSFSLSYDGAPNVIVPVTQTWSASSFTLTPVSQEPAYTGGSFSFDFAVNNPRADASVVAASQANWITDIAVSGNKVTYKVAENNSGAQRTGKIKLTYGSYATAEFTVTQKWSASSFTLTPVSQEAEYTGGSFNFSFSVSNPHSDASVVAESQANWITDVVLNGNKVTYKVAENNSGTQRTGKIKLTYGSYATAEFTVTQKWSASSFTLTPMSQEAEYTGGSFNFSFSVSNPHSDASVVAASQANWITDVVLNGNKVTYKVAENNSGAQRTGKIKLTYGSYATAEFTVTQAWSASSFTLTPASQEAAYTGGSFSFDFAVNNPRADVNVVAASQANWITDVAVSGNKVTYKVAENNSGAQRTGKIKLTYGSYATAEFTVTQKWSASSFALTPVSQEAAYTGGSFNFSFSVSNLHSDASVVAASQANWITDVVLNGNKVTYKVAENNSGAQRTGKIKLTYGSYATAEFTVTQKWSASSFTITPASQEAAYTGGSFSFDFAVNNPRADVNVVAASQANWITDVVLNGNKVTYKVAENNSGAQRTGKVKLTYGSYATAEFTVTQKGKPVTSLSLNKSSLALHPGNSEKLVATVEPSDATLTWSSSDTSVSTASSDGTVTAAGNGTATITVSANDGSGKNAKCTVTVTTLVSSITLDKTSLLLAIGAEATLSVTSVLPDNANDKTYTWSSSDSSIASVDNSGKVTAKANGNATINATANDGSGVFASCYVSVFGEKVDMGIKTSDGKTLYWSTRNLCESGFVNSPVDYGDYYAWGETATKSNYSWSTYKWCNGLSYTLTKYNTSSSYGTVVDGKKVLESSDDVASVKLGGKWRMPTDAEWTELRNNCTWTWVMNYNGSGINGRLVTATNGNSIFLPAAGSRYNYGLSDAGSGGYYWSSSISTGLAYNAWSVRFYSNDVSRYGYNRYYGRSVRPVSE